MSELAGVGKRGSLPAAEGRPAFLSFIAQAIRQSALTPPYEETNRPHLHPAVEQDRYLLYTLLGLLYTLIGIPMIIIGIMKDQTQLEIIGGIYLFGPVFMGGLGFIFFVIAAAIYNLAANMVGGF